MKVSKTAIDGVFIIEPQVFEDARGYFFESWNKAKLKEQGIDYDFIQDNQSKSCFGTIRGIHFQKGEFAQAKLVRVLEGTVLDVAVDLRPGSSTFGRHVAVELSAENKKQLMIPRGSVTAFRCSPPLPCLPTNATTYTAKRPKAGCFTTTRLWALTGK